MTRAPGSRTTGILSYFTRHGTAANLVLVLMIALGAITLPRMRTQYFPDVVIQAMTVTVAWPGAGSEDVDAAIVQVLEPTLLVIEGVESSEARSTEGRAQVTLEFEPDWDMARATDDVESAVAAAAGNLPEDAEDPVIRRQNWRDRVTDVIIAGPVSPDQLGRFADEFVNRLYAQGVTRTTIQGLAAPGTVVEVTTAALIANDIAMADISAAIAAEAASTPAGDVAGGSARIRTGTARRDPAAISSIVLRSAADGTQLTIGDLAEVRSEGADRDRAFFVGDSPAMQIRVDRSDQGDAIGIQAQVRTEADTLQQTLPAGVTATLINTRAEQISDRLELLVKNGLGGLALVLVFLFLFLNARTAIWVAAGIPVSVLAALAVMHWAGLTLNMISLFALIITLGIVVDDAIVVGEHTDYRARDLGEPPLTAAENAVRFMAAPVFASTITTLIAFYGLTAISGRFGQTIADIPFTVNVVLLASLVECFLILPNHMAHALSSVNRTPWYDWPSRQVNRGFSWFRDRMFRPLVGLAVRARYPVLALVMVLLTSQIALVIRGDVPWRFFDSPEEGTISGNFAMLSGATRDDTTAMMRELQRAAAAVGARYASEHGADPISYVVAEIGGNAGRALASSDTKDAELLGAITLGLIDADLRPYSSFDVVAALQDEVKNHPKLEELSFRGWRGGPGGDALDIRLTGADAATLKAAAEALKTALARFPEVSALEDNLAYDKDELILNLTPQGQALGFTIDGLSRDLRNRLNGIEAASYPDGPRSATIRVELPPSEVTADFLNRTMLRSSAGAYVPLADIVVVSQRSGFSTVRRENGQRLVSVSGDLSEDDPARAAEVQTSIDGSVLPDIEQRFGVTTERSGLSQQEDVFLSDALIGLYGSLLGIYLVLAWIFASWTRPVVVMLVIPFGLIGAIWGHAVWNVPLSLFSVVGLIGMAGIIINDAIVLVSAFDAERTTRGNTDAIIEAAASRLRAVFLTTATTVAGLAPLLFETSAQAQFLKPTVITLCYGLGFGMVLVLIVVPAVLAVQEDLRVQLRALRRSLRTGRTMPGTHTMSGALTMSGARAVPGTRAVPGARAVTGVRTAVLALGFGLVALFAVTLLPVMIGGALPQMLTDAVPTLTRAPAQGAALAIFAVGGLLLTLAVYGGTALVLARRRQQRVPRAAVLSD